MMNEMNQVLNAQNAGAVGVVIGDNIPNNPLFQYVLESKSLSRVQAHVLIHFITFPNHRMGYSSNFDPSLITIPAVLVSYNTFYDIFTTYNSSWSREAGYNITRQWIAILDSNGESESMQRP